VTAAGPAYTFPPEEEPRRRRSLTRFQRDLLALVLIVFGVLGALVTIYTIDVQAGVLVTFLAIAGAGAGFGTTRGG
jgi:small-conductance mechanosensitive channel